MVQDISHETRRGLLDMFQLGWIKTRGLFSELYDSRIVVASCHRITAGALYRHRFCWRFEARCDEVIALLSGYRCAGLEKEFDRFVDIICLNSHYRDI